MSNSKIVFYLSSDYQVIIITLAKSELYLLQIGIEKINCYAKTLYDFAFQRYYAENHSVMQPL